MPQPTRYDKSVDFSEYQAGHTSTPFNGADLDAELVAIETNLTGINDNLAMIQRDDGALKNQSVNPETLSASVLALITSGSITINAAGVPWLTGTVYSALNIVTNGTTCYLCAVAHTAGTFATDLAAGKWAVLGNSSPTFPATAIDVAAGHDLTAGNLQVVLEALNAAFRPPTELYNASYYGSP